MQINKDTKLSEIKTGFSEKYPGLKIEFYAFKHDGHEGSPRDTQVTEDYKVSDLNKDVSPGGLTIEESKRVSEVENEFETRFGLNAQIFRRSNELWLQTVSTDHWDLKTQNSKGLHSIQKQKA